ncbi:MAG: hypothetical protein H0U59_05300 [Gemmatimonadaceae bacterium]|nr:hypothetical protein [Gemmatimonadaceae bacterium]
MSATLTGIRPSLWARCVTAAVFQGRGEAEAPHPPEAEEYFWRGNVFEEIVMRQIEAKHGKENVERQVEIPIPGIGTGHADGYLKTEKALLEIKSTTSPYPNSDTFAFGVAQLQRYIAYHPEAEKGYLYMVDPNRMRAAEVREVALTEEDFFRIEAERVEIVEQVAGNAPLALHGSERRPCTRPSQARNRFCPFAAVCFDGWEEPVPNIVSDPEAMRLARLVRDIEFEERDHKAALKVTEPLKRDAKAALSEYCPEKGESVVGPFLVKTWTVSGTVKVSDRALRAAGIDPAPFSTRNPDQIRVQVSESEEHGDIDFGDDTPF